MLTIDFSRSDANKQFNEMKHLLNTFNSDLLKRKPLIIVGTKIDVENAYENILSILINKNINNIL
jgi:GTPase involved in cell partitioning and DNA repair